MVREEMQECGLELIGKPLNAFNAFNALSHTLPTRVKMSGVVREMR